MYETVRQYREIVRREVTSLEGRCRCVIRDGEPGVCPRCGLDGTWDVESIGFGRNYGNSIYFSTVFSEWRCVLCDLRKADD